MSIRKGQVIVAGAGNSRRNIGEVYYSQSSLATDNSGALPLFTGESIASANIIYPEFYAWVEKHTELQTTAEEYESALSTYGECPKYVLSADSLRLPKLANYIKMANTSEGIVQKEAGLPNITGKFDANEHTYDQSNKCEGALYATASSYGNRPTGENGKGLALNFDASRSSEVYGKSDTVTPSHTTLFPWVVAYTSAIEASVAQAAEFQQGLSGKVDLPVGVDNSAVDYVVESYNDGTNWYRVYKSGWLEQGGGVIYDKTNVTFLKPFASANITLLLTRNSSYQGGISSAYHGSWTGVPTETGFTCYCNDDTSYSWRAEGKGA